MNPIELYQWQKSAAKARNVSVQVAVASLVFAAINHLFPDWQPPIWFGAATVAVVSGALEWVRNWWKHRDRKDADK